MYVYDIILVPWDKNEIIIEKGFVKPHSESKGHVVYETFKNTDVPNEHIVTVFTWPQ
jgi:hypothetical protein